MMTIAVLGRADRSPALSAARRYDNAKKRD
jgi:hypothetical protein